MITRIIIRRVFCNRFLSMTSEPPEISCSGGLPGSCRQDSTSMGSTFSSNNNWIRTPYDTDLWSKRQSTPKGCIEFGFLSWNILSQDLIDVHRYLYSQCYWQDLEWVNRWDRIKQTISQRDLKIICLQEVNNTHYFEQVKPFMEGLGFKSLYKKRGGEKKDGCAVFYDPTVFILEGSAGIDFNRDFVSEEQSRENVAIIAKFKSTDLRNHRRLIVATTHLLFNPKRGDIKLAQLRILMAELQKWARRSSSPDKLHPIILAGDFNTQPHSPLYDFIVKGCIEPIGWRKGELSGQRCHPGRTMETKDIFLRGVDLQCSFLPEVNGFSQMNGWSSRHNDNNDSNDSHPNLQDKSEVINIDDQDKPMINHRFKFVSVFPACHPRNNVPFVSSRIQGEASLVDHLFYMASDKLVCLGYKPLPTLQQVAEDGMIPSKSNPSDHFALQAKFLLTP